MTAQTSLSFVGTAKPDQAIDPATFPVVLRVEQVHPSKQEEVRFWTATNENGRGIVTEHASVFTAQSLDELVQRLAAAGFRNVRLDLAGVPAPTHALREGKGEDCPL